MLPEVVVPLIRGFRETGGTWQVQALGDSIDNHVAMKILYMRLFKLATTDASAVVDSNMTFFEGDHNRIDSLTAQWVSRERAGRAIPQHHMLSVSLLSASCPSEGLLQCRQLCPCCGPADLGRCG